MEISKDTKENLPTVVNTGRLLSNASVGNDVVKNNDPIENEIPKFNLLLKSISREIEFLKKFMEVNLQGVMIILQAQFFSKE